MTKSESSHSCDTRTALLEAACCLFSQKGFAAVSTREVADAANVNLGSIQYHFGSKGKLFIDTVRFMMESGGHQVQSHVAPVDCGNCVYSASVRLAQFVRAFLQYLLVPNGPQPCRMMFREIFSETSEDPKMFEALVSTMTEEFAKPLEDMLGKLISVIKPNISSAETGSYIRSILGQCFFYVTHRPFEERLMKVCLSDTATIDRLAKHITQFSLAGLEVPGETIQAVVKEIFGTK